MLFSFLYSDKTQCLVEVSQITYDCDEHYLALHSFRTLRFSCSEVRYNQICNEIYLNGRSDIRDLEMYERDM